MAGFESELFVEDVCECVVVLGDAAVEAEGVVGLEREAPARLVEVVEADCSFGRLERAARVVRFEPGSADTPEEVEQGGVELVDNAFGPGVVGTGEWLSSPE